MTITDTDRAGAVAPGLRRAAAPAVPSSTLLRPLGLGEVAITGGFWGERQRTNAVGTLPHIEHWLEREGWLPNFDLAAAGALPEGRRGREFSDSEIYKYLEAVAWEIGRTGDPALEARFRAIVARVAAAQEPDGYLNTAFGRPGQPPRWTELEWGHELYCAGHLFQAAVARERTRPGDDDGLLGVAVRLADLICATFGDDGIRSVCGHPEVETALVELGRVTGEQRYLDQARLFIERRGSGVLGDIEWGRAYYQDDIPVREAEVLRGHAVRANYLASGAADVAAETADHGLQEALRRQWENTVARRTYITGGQGSHHQDEAFGDDFELPPDRAYSETCAGIASVQFSWRLLLAEGEARYADLVERTLYNVVATSPSHDGTAFYYANTLHRRTPGAPADPDVASPRAEASLRAPWFGVSCCPPNVARTLASLDAYLATASADGLQLHQYAPARIATTLDGGRRVELEVRTGYPLDGRVEVEALADSDGEWTLALRVPAWARGASVKVVSEGREVESATAEPGYAQVRRRFLAGDVVTLDLPLAPRFTWPDPRIDAVRGSVAVERGPVVYALESVDLGPLADDVADVVVDAAQQPALEDQDVVVRVRRREQPDREWPYDGVAESGGAAGGQADATAPVALVPYHAWAERGPSTMRVWLPVE
ncbi:glycoside hydrolase family 127 protein [Leifsonia sp. F6_8S_P_1B]|uniref:Glycoside hydrolase family 127 protein n=1 Tax=Leifsonia williamsii TaxID=3035919 RepID=A0ABT8KAZ5_9MICO|nr:beta-L-arabinofuranosidase domain-containing protein [Leifsonia williamsii]MDN4614227.1 glycoside hydrolase family 127 protein [Leifsonia williamsii]